MENGNITRYFLGANTKDGFYSLYDAFTLPKAGGFIHIIKGGPGCGKSSFMKRIGAAAEAAGQQVEYIHCSGDPDSLDGVWLPEAGVGYVDGTAPHAAEAVYPGAASLYLDLGACYDAEALREKRGEIERLNRSYKALYGLAYARLAAAAALDPRRSPLLFGPEEREILRRRAEGFARRELRPGGTCSERFISAISCKGPLRFDGELKSCQRLFCLENRFGGGWHFLKALLAEAKEKGCGAVRCPDPLFPEETEALIFPGLSLALVCGEPPEGRTEFRRLRPDAAANKKALAENRKNLRRNEKERGALLAAAVESLGEAKLLHDRLEEIYNPHVDFGRVYAAAEEHADALAKLWNAQSRP